MTLNSRNGKAVFLMTLAVLGYSVVPLFVAWGNGGENPILYSAAWGIGTAAGCALVLTFFWRSLTYSEDVWKLAAGKTFSKSMLFWVVSCFTVALYAWSSRFVDVAVTAALYEIYPVLFIALASRLFKSESRYRKITASSVILFAIAFVGAVFVILSQSGGWDVYSSTLTAAPLSLAAGVGLTLGAAAISSLTAYGFKWSANFASTLADVRKMKDFPELFSMILGLALTHLIFSLPAVLLGFALGETLDLSLAAFGAVGGCTIALAASAPWRQANLIARNLEINVMLYLTPAVSLCLLFAFSLAGDVNAAYLATGVALIIAANAFLYLTCLKPARAE